MIHDTVKINLLHLKNSILKLSSEQFVKPLVLLSDSSIGMHARHIIEFYQCLLIGIESGIVNYDNRERDSELEVSPEYCIKIIDEILIEVNKLSLNVDLVLQTSYCTLDSLNKIDVATSVKRELIYNIEHTIHHLAIIKIGIKALDPLITLDESVGVAVSTIRNKNICAQ